MGCEAGDCVFDGGLGMGAGATYREDTSHQLQVLCVRGEPFTTGDNEAGVGGLVVTDKKTNLTWQAGYSKGLSWLTALEYCEINLNKDKLGGFADWRLPSAKELQTIIDDATVDPAVPPVFEAGSDGYFWSSTPFREAGVYSYAIHQMTGSADLWSASLDYYYARCVRGGATGP
jgi:hypothetical protein